MQHVCKHSLRWNTRFLCPCIVDINECEETHVNCSQRALCTNTDGSYNCTCRSGFNGDGFTCIGDWRSCFYSETGRTRTPFVCTCTSCQIGRTFGELHLKEGNVFHSLHIKHSSFLAKYCQFSTNMRHFSLLVCVLLFVLWTLITLYLHVLKLTLSYVLLFLISCHYY